MTDFELVPDGIEMPPRLDTFISDRVKQRKVTTQLYYFVGISFCFGACWCYGRYPQHFPLIYVVAFLVLVPLNWQKLKARNQEGAFKEFCWYVNFVLVIFCVALFVMWFTIDDSTEHILRPWIFCMSWSTSTGVLAVMALVNGNQLSFHHLPTIGESFIHVFPTLVMYTIRWQSNVVREAYPMLVDLDYLDALTARHIFKGLLYIYLPWWTCYFIWAMTCGIRREHEHYSDFFAQNLKKVRRHVPQIRNLYTEPDSPPVRGDVLLVMIGHATVVLPMSIPAVAAYWYRDFHIAMNCLIVGRMIFLGSSRLADVTLYYDTVKVLCKAHPHKDHMMEV